MRTIPFTTLNFLIILAVACVFAGCASKPTEEAAAAATSGSEAPCAALVELGRGPKSDPSPAGCTEATKRLNEKKKR